MVPRARRHGSRVWCRHGATKGQSDPAPNPSCLTSRLQQQAAPEGVCSACCSDRALNPAAATSARPVVVLIAEGAVADDAAAGVPEPRRGVRRPQHLAAVRVQEHLRRGHHALGGQRGDLRRPLLRLLDAHPHPAPQVRHHRPARRRQRRRYVRASATASCSLHPDPAVQHHQPALF